MAGFGACFEAGCRDWIAQLVRGSQVLDSTALRAGEAPLKIRLSGFRYMRVTTVYAAVSEWV